MRIASSLPFCAKAKWGGRLSLFGESHLPEYCTIEVVSLPVIFSNQIEDFQLLEFPQDNLEEFAKYLPILLVQVFVV